MFPFNFTRRVPGKLCLNPADIRKGTVLTHMPTGTRHTAVYAVQGDVLLIDDNGQLSAPSFKQLAQQYCCRGYQVRYAPELEALWQKAVTRYQADKRLLTRLGLRGNNPASIRKALAV